VYPEALAVRRFDEFNKIDRELLGNWENFLTNGSVSGQCHRPVISSSWKRCQDRAVDPLKYLADTLPNESLLLQKRENNQSLLSAAKPCMEELLKYFRGEPFAVVLADEEGVIIDGTYNHEVLARMERHRFIPGSTWAEARAGTNAIGTTLAEGKAVQIFSAEHFCQGWHDWVCSAAPIRDPFTGQVIGVLDITGEKKLVQAHDLYLVLEQAHKIEQTLREQSLLDLVTDPYVIFDASGKVLQMNSVALHVLPLRPGDFLFPHLEATPYPLPKEIKTVFRTDNSEWLVQLRPYRSGGVALFERRVPRKTTTHTPATRYTFSDFLTKDPKVLHVINFAKRAALSDKTILITGETGTGKEVLAQSIHAHSMRRSGPFIAVNCGAIPKELLVSELFGYEEGAFTGAKSGGKKGKFKAANGGTLFLDEIGELPLPAQATLLRALEERVITPVGSTRSFPVDVRVIAATHRNLKDGIRKGTFREDLYFRLNVIELVLPPLRERKDDIAFLVRHFLRQAEPSAEVLEALCNYSWPGNVRQLKNILEQAEFRTETGIIQITDLPIEFRIPRVISKTERKPVLTPETLKQALQEAEGNISKAAQALSVSRMTIYRKLKEFEM
jgi:transcriptional regulator of acetoin/glycerol metabolism